MLFRSAFKKVAPDITIVSGGLAPTTNSDRSVDDLTFAQQMFSAGAGSCFDAFGYHPYGYNQPPEEIVFGAVGQFWAGKTQWETVTADEWERFDRPGFAKIACNFLLQSHGDDRTLVTYEARTLALDDTSRRGFRRYWRVVSPFVGVVMRSMLALVGREATTFIQPKSRR